MRIEQTITRIGFWLRENAGALMDGEANDNGRYAMKDKHMFRIAVAGMRFGGAFVPIYVNHPDVNQADIQMPAGHIERIDHA